MTINGEADSESKQMITSRLVLPEWREWRELSATLELGGWEMV
jgi:hypothetical protein